MRRLLAGVVALLLAATYLTSAFAQSGTSVRQSGTVTPNTVPAWVTSGVISGNITSADSPVTSFGVTSANAAGICANSARQSTGAWQALCLGMLSGVPTISVQNYGSAPVQSLQFVINGAAQGFLTVSPLPVVIGNFPCFTSTAGGLKDCGISSTNPTFAGITLSPTASTTNQALVTSQTPSGTSVAPNTPTTLYPNASTFSLNSMAIASEAVQLNTSSGAVNGFSIVDSYGGSSVVGNRQGLYVQGDLTAASGNTAGNYVAGTFFQGAGSNDGGGSGTERGSFFGLNPVAYAYAAATHIQELAGMEVNVGAQTGSAMVGKVGLSVTQLATDAVQGTTTDAAIWVANQSGAVGWKDGLLFDATTAAPFTSGATVIASRGSNTLTNGVDFSSFTFTGSAFKSTGFSVDGSGNLAANNVTTAWSAFTPSLTCAASGNTTFTSNSARSKTMGKTTFIQIDFSVNTLGTGCIQAAFTLPNTAQSSGAISGQDLGSPNNNAVCRIAASSATVNCVLQGAGNYTASTHIVASGVYENQ